MRDLADDHNHRKVRFFMELMSYIVGILTIKFAGVKQNGRFVKWVINPGLKKPSEGMKPSEGYNYMNMWF